MISFETITHRLALALCLATPQVIAQTPYPVDTVAGGYLLRDWNRYVLTRSSEDLLAFYNSLLAVDLVEMDKQRMFPPLEDAMANNFAILRERIRALDTCTVRIAFVLRVFTYNADFSQGLNFQLADIIVPAPHLFLEELKKRPSNLVNAVCACDPPRDSPDTDCVGVAKRRIQSLARVTDPQLTAIRDACIALLKETYSGLQTPSK